MSKQQSKQPAPLAVAAAVASAVSPEAGENLAAALAAFAVAALAVDEHAGNEWEQYVLCVAYGASADDIKESTRETLAAAVKAGKASPDAWDRATNRMRQYKARCATLADAGIRLLDGEGRVRSFASVVVDGNEFSGSLSTVARNIAAAKTKANGTGKRGTKARKDGEDGEDAAPTIIAANPDTVPLTRALVERIAAALASPGEVGDMIAAVLVAGAPDAVMAMAATVARGRVVAEAAQAAEAAKAAAATVATAKAAAATVAKTGAKLTPPKRAKAKAQAAA